MRVQYNNPFVAHLQPQIKQHEIIYCPSQMANLTNLPKLLRFPVAVKVQGNLLKQPYIGLNYKINKGNTVIATEFLTIV